MLESIIIGVWVVFTLLLFNSWGNERDKRADLETDLCSVIREHDLDSRDLRRSTRYKSVREAIESNYTDTLEFIERNR